MELQPSLSVIKGKIIRLTKGNYEDETNYDVSPVDVTRHFEEHGVEKVHLVDLEGAKRGAAINFDTLGLIKGYTSLKVNFAGGIHTDGDLLKAFESGADSVTAATVAVYQPTLFSAWIMSYGREKIHLGADALNDLIRVGGWQKGTEITVFNHVERFYNRGLKYVKTTDIARDGLMEGPAFKLYEALIKRFPNLKVYASGGIRHMDDIRQLEQLGVHGVIFGKAYYEGKITLKEIETYLASQRGIGS